MQFGHFIDHRQHGNMVDLLSGYLTHKTAQFLHGGDDKALEDPAAKQQQDSQTQQQPGNQAGADLGRGAGYCFFRNPGYQFQILVQGTSLQMIAVDAVLLIGADWRFTSRYIQQSGIGCVDELMALCFYQLQLEAI